MNTISWIMHKDSGLTQEEQISKLESYNTGDLLCVLRDFEDDPYEYDGIIIKKVYGLLGKKGIMCI